MNLLALLSLSLLMTPACLSSDKDATSQMTKWPSRYEDLYFDEEQSPDEEVEELITEDPLTDDLFIEDHNMHAFFLPSLFKGNTSLAASKGDTDLPADSSSRTSIPKKMKRRKLIKIVEYPERRVAKYIWTYVSPVLLIVGTTGNTLSLIVMCQHRLRSSVTSFLLTVLALCDTIVLMVGLLRHWLHNVFKTDIRALTLWGCRSHLFMTYWATDFSAWVIAVVTLERFFGVFHPLKARLYITKSFIVCLLLEIAFILSCINGHFLWTAELKDFPRMGPKCGVFSNGFRYFIRTVWPWIDLATMSLLPSCIIFTGNLAIIIKLCHSKIRRWQGTATSGVKLTSRTGNLLAIALFFLLTTLPIVVYLVLEQQWKRFPTPVSSRKRAKAELAWVCVNVLHYLNYSANFFLYCLSGSQFRNQLKVLLCSRLNRVVPVPFAANRSRQDLQRQEAIRQAGPSTQQTFATSSSCMRSSPTTSPSTSHKPIGDRTPMSTLRDAPGSGNYKTHGLLEVTLKPPSVRWAPKRNNQVSPMGPLLQPRDPIAR